MSKKRAKKKISWKRIWPFYLMALPGFLYMLINNYIPMFGISIAFKKLNFREGIWGSPWVGFKNFKFLFGIRGCLDHHPEHDSLQCGLFHCGKCPCYYHCHPDQ